MASNNTFSDLGSNNAASATQTPPPTDRIRAVLSGAEIQTVLARYTAPLRCRITVPKITVQYGSFTAVK